MTMHDWTRLDDGLWHDMHLGWVSYLSGELDQHILQGHPAYSLMEYNVAPLRSTLKYDLPDHTFDGLDEETFYLRKRRTVTVRRSGDHAKVGLVEILSPGVKRGARTVTAFAEKMAAAVRLGFGVIVVDPFPPTEHAPGGVHAAIWQQLTGQPFEMPDKPLVVASYRRMAGGPIAEVEPFTVGDPVPDGRLALPSGQVVILPLEATYSRAVQGVSWYTRERLAAGGRTSGL